MEVRYKGGSIPQDLIVIIAEKRRFSLRMPGEGAAPLPGRELIAVRINSDEALALSETVRIEGRDWVDELFCRMDLTDFSETYLQKCSKELKEGEQMSETGRMALVFAVIDRAQRARSNFVFQNIGLSVQATVQAAF